MLGVGLGLTQPRGRAAGFVPTDIADLLVWLDASDLATITESGGSVSQWDDKSGNGNHATQAVGTSQFTTGTVTKNGLNVLVSAEKGDHMDIVGATPSQPVTIIGMFNRDAGSSGGISDGRSGTERNLHGYGESNLVFGQRMFAGTQVTPFATSISGGTYINWAAAFNGASSFAYRNGEKSGTVDPGAQNLTAGIRILGHATNSASFGAVGKVGEFMVYDRVLTDDELAAIDTYLNGKWAVYS